jgi:hypothetical protein
MNNNKTPNLIYLIPLQIMNNNKTPNLIYLIPLQIMNNNITPNLIYLIPLQIMNNNKTPTTLKKYPEKTPTCRKSMTNFITQCGIEYTSPSAGFEHTTLVVILAPIATTMRSWPRLALMYITYIISVLTKYLLSQTSGSVYDTVTNSIKSSEIFLLNISEILMRRTSQFLYGWWTFYCHQNERCNIN